jgi:hypothetical protein
MTDDSVYRLDGLSPQRHSLSHMSQPDPSPTDSPPHQDRPGPTSTTSLTRDSGATAILLRDKKQKACANCRRAKLKCIFGDETVCVRCKARKEQCISYPRAHVSNLEDKADVAGRKLAAERIHGSLCRYSPYTVSHQRGTSPLYPACRPRDRYTVGRLRRVSTIRGT